MTEADEMRRQMEPVSGALRAFFAPVDRERELATVFDPSREFALDAPPAPWVDLGWVSDVQRSATAKVESVRTGTKALAKLQFRTMCEARVTLEFCEWGKLQMALAAGSQHMNVLAGDAGGGTKAAGSTALAAVTLGTGSTANELFLDTNGLAAFNAGDLVAVDVDYAQQAGYVGSGIAGAYVADPSKVNHDADYVRRVTFNVGRVAEKTLTSLKLQQPLLGGAPASSAKAQKVVGFVDREGASFLQEWSALFVMPEVSGGRICFYYPRLVAGGPAEERVTELASPYRVAALRASFMALPWEDETDGEPVVCYRSFFPASGSGMY